MNFIIYLFYIFYLVLIIFLVDYRNNLYYFSKTNRCKDIYVSTNVSTRRVLAELSTPEHENGDTTKVKKVDTIEKNYKNYYFDTNEKEDSIEESIFHNPAILLKELSKYVIPFKVLRMIQYTSKYENLVKKEFDSLVVASNKRYVHLLNNIKYATHRILLFIDETFLDNVCNMMLEVNISSCLEEGSLREYVESLADLNDHAFNLDDVIKEELLEKLISRGCNLLVHINHITNFFKKYGLEYPLEFLPMRWFKWDGRNYNNFEHNLQIYMGGIESGLANIGLINNQNIESQFKMLKGILNHLVTMRKLISRHVDVNSRTLYSYMLKDINGFLKCTVAIVDFIFKKEDLRYQNNKYHYMDLFGGFRYEEDIKKSIHDLFLIEYKNISKGKDLFQKKLLMDFYIDLTSDDEYKNLGNQVTESKHLEMIKKLYEDIARGFFLDQILEEIINIVNQVLMNMMNISSKSIKKNIKQKDKKIFDVKNNSLEEDFLSLRNKFQILNRIIKKLINHTEFIEHIDEIVNGLELHSIRLRSKIRIMSILKEKINKYKAKSYENEEKKRIIEKEIILFCYLLQNKF